VNPDVASLVPEQCKLHRI